MIGAKPRHLWIGIPLAFYLAFSLPYLDLPGLQYDELLFANAALGNVDGSFVEWQIRVLGRKVPLMLMEYIGALKAALYAPIFALFGLSPTTVRLPVILIGLATLLLTFALVRRLLGRSVALITLALLALDPTFIFANRLDWGPVALMLLLEVSSLYFLARWITGGEPRFLMIAGFLLGLGLYNKVIFIWYIAAFSVSLWLCFREHMGQLLNPRRLLLAAGAFLMGCLPLIAFNIASSKATFRYHELITQDWPSSLKYRYRLFRTTLDGSAVYDVVNRARVAETPDSSKIEPRNIFNRFIIGMGNLPLIEGTLLPPALVSALSVILVLFLLKRLEQKRQVFFFLLQFAFITVFICLTQEAIGPHHAIAIYPFPHVLIGLALWQVSRLCCARIVTRSLVSILCLSPLILTELTADARYVESFIIRGGVGGWSDAIYELAEFAKRHPDKTFLLMDWGFKNQLLLLSDGFVKKEEAFVPLVDLPVDDKILRLKPILTVEDAFFVFHAPPSESFPIFEAFRSALERYGLEGIPVRTFYQRDGRPIYLVYQVQRPDAENPGRKGRFFYLREAEDFNARSGGGLDLKQGASRGKALGDSWGQQRSDFVVYRFTLPRKVTNIYLYLRYAFEGREPHQYYLFIDGNLIECFRLPPTPGFGYSTGEWRTFMIRIGTLNAGNRELKFAPVFEGQIVNLDYFYLSEGEHSPPANPVVLPTKPERGTGNELQSGKPREPAANSQ